LRAKAPPSPTLHEWSCKVREREGARIGRLLRENVSPQRGGKKLKDFGAKEGGLRRRNGEKEANVTATTRGIGGKSKR